MINLGGLRQALGRESGFFAALDAMAPLAHGGFMNGLLAICAICREITS
jgi:hypothetical protein